MNDATILILPGLDGTDLMLGKFHQLCAENNRVVVGTLPADAVANYAKLADYFSTIVADLSACHIVAESFSGPIGVLLAHRYPEIVTRLTLVASFVTSPVPLIAWALPWSTMFRLPMPAIIARYFFVGQCTSVIPILKSAIRQNTPTILRHRLRLVQNVDVSNYYSELKCQLSYIRATNDRLVPRHCVDKTVELNAGTIVHDIESSHLVLETHPENSWQIIAG